MLVRGWQSRWSRLEKQIAILQARCAPLAVQYAPLAIEPWVGQYLPHYFTRPFSRFHVWLAGELDRLHTHRGSRRVLVAPRGSAKSTWVSLAYPLWAALHGHERYVLLISDSQAQARLLLEAFRREIEENRLLADAYPAAVGQGRPWSQDRLRLANGVVVEALGTGAKIRGRRNQAERPSLIVVDDPENDQHVTSPVQRERSWSWFNRAVSNAGTPDTNVLVLGTALHRDCLVLRLTRTPGWQARTFRAIETWPERMDLWQEWEQRFTDIDDAEHETKARAFYETQQEALAQGCVLLWPERESLYDLMVQRVTIGHAAFESEKQANPINPEACEWPAEYFGGPGFWFDDWPRDLTTKVLSLDPSKGKDARSGDYSAIVKLGMDRSMVMYCEADLKRRPTPQVVADGVEMVRDFQPHGFAIEVNQYQELLVREFERVAREQGVMLPIYPLENMVNKEVRIRRLGTYLSQRKLRFKSRSPGTALLVQQLQDFPVGDHDDGPDALEQGVRLMIEMWNGRHRRPLPRGLRV